MKLEITINEEKHNLGLSWGLGCFEIACEHLNFNTVDEAIILSLKDEASLSRLVYSALQNDLELQNESATMPFSIRQFQHWLSQQDQKIATEIVQDLNKSIYNGKTMGEYYEYLGKLYAVDKVDEPEPVLAEKKEVKKKVVRKKPLPKS